MASVNLLDENLLLWNKFRNGNTDAFGELMRTHYPDLFHYGTRFTKDTGLVKECIQGVFLTLWVNRLSISENSFIKYYLLKSLRNDLTRAIGRSRRRAEPAFEYFLDNARLPESPGDEQLADQARKMRKILSGLSRRQQEVIYLCFYLDADTDEIAEIMSLNRQSVQHLLHDALRRLRKPNPKIASWFPTFQRLLTS